MPKDNKNKQPAKPQQKAKTLSPAAKLRAAEEAEALRIKAAKDAAEAKKVEIKDARAGVKEADGKVREAQSKVNKAQSELASVEKKAGKVRSNFEKLTGTAKESISSAVDSAKGIWKKAMGGKLHNELGKVDDVKLTNLEKDLAKATKAAEKAAGKTKVSAKEVKSTQKAVEGIQKSIGKVKENLTKTRGAEFERLSHTNQFVAKVGGNLGKSTGNLEKGLRIGGSVVGLGAVISGAKDIFAPARDENGERKNGFAKTALKLAGGAAAIYFSLTHGGANKAMGIVR